MRARFIRITSQFRVTEDTGANTGSRPFYTFCQTGKLTVSCLAVPGDWKGLKVKGQKGKTLVQRWTRTGSENAQFENERYARSMR